MKPHEYKELIYLWADGVEIQERYIDKENQDLYDWVDFNGDWSWTENYEYRIKPKQKPCNGFCGEQECKENQKNCERARMARKLLGSGTPQTKLLHEFKGYEVVEQNDFDVTVRMPIDDWQHLISDAPQTKPLSGDETHEPDVEDWQPNVRFEDGVYRFDLPNGDEFVIVPKQDEVVYGNAKSYENPCFLQTKLKDSNLKLTFDGETGELKSAEVLK